jgi:hypothetical protein
MEHCFAAGEFAQRRAQHRTAVRSARIGRLAGAFELELLPRPIGRDQLGKPDGASIAELARPVAELVTAVARGIGLHAGQHAIARQHFDGKRARAREAEQLAQRVGPGEQPRRRDRRRRDARIAGVRDLPRHVDEHRIARQLMHERVLEARGGEIDRCRAALGSGEGHDQLSRAAAHSGCAGASRRIDRRKRSPEIRLREREIEHVVGAVAEAGEIQAPGIDRALRADGGDHFAHGIRVAMPEVAGERQLRRR